MGLVSKLEEASALDGVVSVGQRVARQLRRGRLRDALHGVWLGHPLHPVLVQAPVGAWLSAAVVDSWQATSGQRGRDDADAGAARLLAAFGLCAAAPAALAGLADWSEQHEQQMRVGVIHWLANTVAVSMYAASLATRRPGAARACRFTGLAAAGIGGLLGGHISFRQAGGANHAESVPHLVEPGWHDLGEVASLPVDKPSRRLLGEVPLLVMRDGDRVHVLADRCSHLSGPLTDGEVSDGCVTCPWHGSTFRLADGSVVHGPATAPQPAFQARVRDGVLQVCLPGAG